MGVEVKDTDGSTYFRGPGAGTAVYLTHLRAKSRDFIKGGDAIFLLTMEGKSTGSQYKLNRFKHKKLCVQIKGIRYELPRTADHLCYLFFFF